MRLLPAFLALLCLTGTVEAAPRVVTSIPPLQGLVADVMAGAGAPVLLLNASVSPHDFAMRPSQLRALGEADIVFYVGLGLEPWIEKPLSALSALKIPLGDAASPRKLPKRDLQDFGSDTGSGTDPHVWLSPDNALLWLDIIAGILEQRDPENAALYRANTEKQRVAILAAQENSARALEALKDTKLVFTHDSLQYFDKTFRLNAIGAFVNVDGKEAGARTVGGLLEKIDAATCLVEDANEPSAIFAQLPDSLKRAVVDPLGYPLLNGPDFYPRLLREITLGLEGCLP